MPRKGEGLVGSVPLVLPGLHPGQIRVLREAKQENWLCAGRGWWKSSLFIRIAWDALEAGKVVLWTAFTSEPIDIVIEELWKKKVFGEKVWNACYHETKKMLMLPGKPPLRFASLQEARSQRGGTPDVIIMDEAGETARGDAASVLEPMLFKSDGVLWAGGTPNPKDPLNDFYEKLTSKSVDTSYTARWVIPVVGAYVTEDGRLIRKPHPYENPHYGFQRLKRSFDKALPSQKTAWEVEYLCVFKLGGANQIDNPELACTLACVPTHEFPQEYVLAGWEPSSQDHLKAGVDVAVSDNETVLCVGDMHTKRLVYFRHFTPTGGTEQGRWKQVREAIQRLRELFPTLSDLNVDVTGLGNALQEDMPNDYGCEITPFNFAGNTTKKTEVMDHLKDFVEQRCFLLFNLEVIKEQLSTLKRTLREGGGFKIAAPPGKLDDIPIALGLLLKDEPITGTGGAVARADELYHLIASSLKAKPEERLSPGSVARPPDFGNIWGVSGPAWPF